jgi:hypothetical protein
MAAKNDNTIFWIAALGLGGYLWYKHKNAAAPAGSAPVNAPTNLSSSAPYQPVANAPAAILMLPPSPVLNSSAPANAASSAPGSPASSGPIPVNTTGLAPAAVAPNEMMTSQPIFLNTNGSPIVTADGLPLTSAVLQPAFSDPTTLAAQKWANIDYARAMSGAEDYGECL